MILKLTGEGRICSETVHKTHIFGIKGLTLCFTVACGWECGGARPVIEMKELEYTGKGG